MRCFFKMLQIRAVSIKYLAKTARRAAMGTLSLSDFEEVRISAPWGEISGRWYGNRSVRPILAMHGWLDNMGTFDPLIPYLPDYPGLLSIDLAGHGTSSHLPAGMHYSADDWVLVIARIKKQFNWPKVSMMGHSLGGMLGFIYASLYPDNVDLLISLDILVPPFDAPKNLKVMSYFMDKHLKEEDHSHAALACERPTYTLSTMRKLLSQGSNNSVAPELAHHLLYRSVTKSHLYPDKYYFSRDGRIKYYTLYPMSPGLAAAMISRIKDVPYLVVKGSESAYVRPDCEEAISIQKRINPHFAVRVAEGGHHVHMTNPEGCAQHIVPFIRHYRPPPMGSWALANGERPPGEQEQTRESFFAENPKNKL